MYKTRNAQNEVVLLWKERGKKARDILSSFLLFSESILSFTPAVIVDDEDNDDDDDDDESTSK